MNEKSEETAFDETREILLNLSKQDFLSFGMRDLAYIRPVIVEDRQVYAVHAANGIPLSVTEDFSAAISTIADNDLQAVALH